MEEAGLQQQDFRCTAAQVMLHHKNNGHHYGGGLAAAVFGQLDIHQKIKQLNFRDCRSKIR